MSAQEGPPKLRILGLSISREVNVLALAAFAFSLISLGWQSFYLLSGPQLALALNGRVNIVLYSDDGLDGSDGPWTVLLNSGVAFHNSGAEGYDAVVRSMQVQLTLRDGTKERHWEYVWVHFENFTAGAGGGPIATGTVSANQLLVPGRDQVARQVSFVGFGQPTRLSQPALTTPLSWKTFGRALEANPSLSLLFVAETARGESVATCDLSIGKVDLERLANRRWTTVYCDTDMLGSSSKDE